MKVEKPETNCNVVFLKEEYNYIIGIEMTL